MKALKTNFLFSGLTDEALEMVADNMNSVTAAEGDVVIQQGDEGEKANSCSNWRWFTSLTIVSMLL